MEPSCGDALCLASVSIFPDGIERPSKRLVLIVIAWDETWNDSIFLIKQMEPNSIAGLNGVSFFLPLSFLLSFFDINHQK